MFRELHFTNLNTILLIKFNFINKLINTILYLVM